MCRFSFILPMLAIAVMLFAAPALAGTVTIHGTVTDADGNPVPGADVTLFDSDKTELASVESDASGHFAFTSARVDTDYCAVRVFYNDGRQTYTNAAYLTAALYAAKGDQSVPVKDTQLERLHMSAQTDASTATPRSPGLSAAATSLALIIAAGASLLVLKGKQG